MSSNWLLPSVLILCVAFSITRADDAQDNTQIMRVIEGQVTDPKGRPIKGAAVEWGVYDHERRFREVFRTDDQGRYRIETSKAGIDYRLGVSAAGFAPSWRDGVVPVRKEGEPPQIDFQLGLPISLRGTVVDKDGEPIEGVTVLAQSPVTGFYSSFSVPSPTYPFPGPERSATTDGNGRFVIRNLPTTLRMSKDPKTGSPFQIYVMHGRSRRSRGKAYSGEENRLVENRESFLNEEDAVGVVRGRVVDAETQQPIRSFRVARRHHPQMHVFDDENGRFELDRLSMGTRYQFFVYADGYAPTIQLAHPIRSSSRRFDIFQVKRSPGFSGELVNDQDEPIQGAKLVFIVGPSDPKDPNMGSWRSCDQFNDGLYGHETVQRSVTGDNGQFTFCLAPDRDPDPAANPQQQKKPWLWILAPGYVRELVSINDLSESTKNQSHRITLRRESKLSVKATSVGEFSPSIDVRVVPASGSVRGLELPTYDGEQRYQIGSLAPGKYRINVSIPKGSSSISLSRQVEVSEGESKEVAMNFEFGSCELSGTGPKFAGVKLAATRKSAETHFLDSFSTTIDADGNYRFFGLPAGTYQLRCQRATSRRSTYSRRQPATSTTVVIPEGSAKKCDIEIPPNPFPMMIR